MRIGSREFEIGKQTYVMGILNATPDSFSDGGNYLYLDDALSRAEDLILEGADILDIGGESTRPNHTRVSDTEEISRVIPLIREIRKRWDIPISIDTYKPEVAVAALEAGADMVNDIWGLKYDGGMADVIRNYRVPICLMHNGNNKEYKNLILDVIADLEESVGIAEDAGIDRRQLIIDPGIGFAKTREQNLEVISNLQCLKVMGLPILFGASRKSVIGLTLNLPITEREEGTIATTVVATMAGCDFIRVHDVKKNVRAIKMTEAILDF